MTTAENPPQRPDDDGKLSPLRKRRIPVYASLIIALSVIGIAIYLVFDHWPHILAALPYLGIIAVAAMHLFGHGGHGGGHNHGHNRGDDDNHAEAGNSV